MSKILVVDDRMDVRMSLEAMLEEGDHEIVLAENGEVALNVIEREIFSVPFDLVISDVMMPELDGIELVTALNIGMGDNKPKVIIISGGGFNMLADDLLAAASDIADHVLRKPFTGDELITVVNNVLS